MKGVTNLRRKMRSYYTTFVGVLENEGKKSKVKNLFDKAVANARDSLNRYRYFYNVSQIIYSLVNKAAITIETKTRRRGHNLFLIPNPVLPRRRAYLTTKNFITSALTKKIVVGNATRKMSHEMVNIRLRRNNLAKTLFRREEHSETLLENRGYIHFIKRKRR